MNRSLATEVETVKNDCEGMLKVMTTMEKQLSEFSAREDAINEVLQMHLLFG